MQETNFSSKKDDNDVNLIEKTHGGDSLLFEDD